jgi:glutamate/tyrosine decarboxylase-like PLP-dependent enzyme
MIKSLGRDGIAAVVSRHCALARRFADKLAASPNIEIMNEVVLNQVAVRFGADMDDAHADALTLKVIDRIQQDGVCFVGGAHWRGGQIMRISVIGAATKDSDVDRSAEAMLSAWRTVRGANA